MALSDIFYPFNPSRILLNGCFVFSDIGRVGLNVGCIRLNSRFVFSDILGVFFDLTIVSVKLSFCYGEPRIYGIYYPPLFKASDVSTLCFSHAVLLWILDVYMVSTSAALTRTLPETAYNTAIAINDFFIFFSLRKI